MYIAAHKSGRTLYHVNVQSIQLEGPSVRHSDLVWTLSYLGQISNLRQFLNSSTQTTWGKVLVFFVKPKTGSFDQFLRFLHHESDFKVCTYIIVLNRYYDHQGTIAEYECLKKEYYECPHSRHSNMC